SSRPTSTTTRLPRPRTASTPKAGCCARARPGKNPAPPPTIPVRSPSITNCRAIRTRTTRRPRATKTEVTEAGRVNRISVAVLVDGSYSKNDKGEMVYQERGKEQLDRIAAL